MIVRPIVKGYRLHGSISRRDRGMVCRGAGVVDRTLLQRGRGRPEESTRVERHGAIGVGKRK
ncbi:hypothetical protein JQ557_03890 [Bradyrhizobium sp. U87765 SZCCT0131]|uniref:hypothetical protein n=1 Tax=unclassified Bradyrhizobium TaxID=2631580 RepID=UPI001BACC093|nr:MULTISPECIES: hypothetical protein [unclassified Bradyrhizobium]MBR1217118.1 hypothetical protein [Bradyrhizobium sp. U87765 SZCCT0131]MBR1259126.1 hypothetical protein [Bradyrhizobium sp. U87765 SZCCT0134]MBR1305267.1 hypothetical protein [Bradyrhizobium sp. U87765 SZCCT0110]MBR1321053.1 hypothetical protein [Bradyrhizobium sp. U87765 SZCCT0109]MBR1350293.1 hypothetical protein [Bradyrhizobium sp. U87765 SZCCT0048]